MPDLSTKTNEQLFDRLGELETQLSAEPLAGDLITEVARRVINALREVGLIHIELARRTATGWRPL